MKLGLSFQPRIIYKLLIVLVLTFLFFTPIYKSAHASNTPILAGTSLTMDVRNSTNIVYGAEVTLTSTALPFPLKLKADNNGFHIFNNLPLGEYSVTVSAPGYTTSSNVSIGALSSNQNNTRTVQLVADSSLIGIDYLSFSDSNNNSGIIAGTVYWSTYGTIPTNAEIHVQLYNDQNTPIGTLLGTVPTSASSQYSLSDLTLPLGATRIGVQLVSDSTVIAQKSILLWEGNNYYPLNLKFIDSNSNLGINGSISWTGPSDETFIGGYRIYYWAKESNWRYWDVVGKRSDKTYQYSFDSLPANTGAILIGINSTQGEEQNSYPTAYIYDNRITDTVLSATYDQTLPFVTAISDNTIASSAGTIGGSFSWNVSLADLSLLKGYNVYFSNSAGDKLQAIGTRYLAGTGNTYINFVLDQITNSALIVPSGATQLALYALSNGGAESAPYFFPIKTYTGSNGNTSPCPNNTANNSQNLLVGTSISITVKDSITSCLLGYANVTLTSTALPYPIMLKTDANGLVNFINLPPGDYSINVANAGYKTSATIPLGAITLNQNKTQTVTLVRDPNLFGFGSLNFNDTNSTPGILAGTVYWSTYGNISANAQIQIQFYNDQNTPVGNPLVSLTASANTHYILPNTVIPVNATRFGVQLLSASNVIALNTMPIMEYESVHPSNLRFIDAKDTLGIAGTVSWTGGDESQIGGYRIYYSIKGSTLNYWDVVAKRPDKTYQYTFSSQLPNNTGAILIGVNNVNGEELNAYPAAFILDNRLSDTVISATYSPSLPLASNIRDYTYTNSQNTIRGQIFLDVPADVSQIKGFTLYFSNSTGGKIQAIATSYLEGSNPGNYLILDNLTNSSLIVPSGATQFALYSLGNDGTESAPIFIPIKTYNSPSTVSLPSTQLPYNLKFIDLDAESQKIHGYITWSKALDESNLKSYLVVTLDHNDQPLSLLGEVMKGSLPLLTIPAGFSIPSGATQIGIIVNTIDLKTSSNKINILLNDNISLTGVRNAVKTDYLHGVTQLGVEHVVAFLNEQKSSITFSRDDIKLFLSLIEPINNP